MLILERGIDEQIMILDPDHGLIVVMLCDIQGYGKATKARIGVSAPRKVRVDRLEVAIDRKRNPRARKRS